MSDAKGKPQKSDEELMIAYLQDDSSAFNELYDRLSDQIYGYLRRRIDDPMLADDIFQATFFKFHQTRSQYRAPLPVLPWLFTICRSVMIDTLRGKGRKLDRLEDVPTAFLSQPAEQEASPVLQPAVLEGISGTKQLTSEQKKAIELRFGHDLSFEEIAVELQTSPLNVRQLLSRGLRKLKLAGQKNRGGG